MICAFSRGCKKIAKKWYFLCKKHPEKVMMCVCASLDMHEKMDKKTMSKRECCTRRKEREEE